MPVSHYHRTIFVHVPKTAGTSIELALGIRHREDGSEFYPLRLYGRQLQHRTAAEMKYHILDPQRRQGDVPKIVETLRGYAFLLWCFGISLFGVCDGRQWLYFTLAEQFSYKARLRYGSYTQACD